MQQDHPKRRPLSTKKHPMIYHNTVIPVFITLQYYSGRNCRKFGWNIWSLWKCDWNLSLLHHQMQNLVTDLCFRLTLQILCRQSQRIITRIAINTVKHNNYLFQCYTNKLLRPLMPSSRWTRTKKHVRISSGNIYPYDFTLVQPEDGRLGRNMLLK